MEIAALQGWRPLLGIGVPVDARCHLQADGKSEIALCDAFLARMWPLTDNPDLGIVAKRGC